MERGLAQIWARENGQYWPASLLEVTEDGSYHVSFLGWGRRHDLVLPPASEDGEPSVLFEEPARVRNKPQPVALCVPDTPPRDKSSKGRKRPRHQAAAQSPCMPRRLLSSGSSSSSSSSYVESSPPPAIREPMKIKIRVPQDLTCAACSGKGRGDQMVRCEGGCHSWAHRGCAGFGESEGSRPGRRSFVCPECEAPPLWQESPSFSATAESLAEASAEPPLEAQEGARATGGRGE